jgi:hypothetical protein
MAVITPDRFDPMLRYVNVRVQQGVPIVDADENERDDIRKFELRAFLKWFVGDGVPEGSDGFRVAGAGLANDFQVLRGAPAAPAGLNNVEVALRHVGRCLVDGLDAIITADVTFSAQPLHVGQPGAATLAAALGVPTVAMPAPADGVLAAYLDVWERLVTPSEEPALVLPGLGVESCARIRREWVVRVRPGTAAPAPGDPDFLPGHSYYVLATVTRRASSPAILATDVADRRERRLLVLPATLTTDLFGTSAADYRRGLGRPAVSLREAINALLRGELPSSPDTALAPDPSLDFMSYAFGFQPTGATYAVWQSRRAGGINQVFATSTDPGNPAAGFVTPPQQVTTGVAHALPQAVLLPNDDFVVVYETNQQDVHFKRAQLMSLNGAAEQPLAVTAAVAERHPFAVLVNDLVVFFWHRAAPSPRWQFRRWRHTDNTFIDAAEQQLSAADAAAPALNAGDFHAVADAAGEVWVAFRRANNNIQAVRLRPATGLLEEQELSTAGTDQEPFVVVDGSAAVWVFWRSEAGVHYQRFRQDTAPPAWEAGPSNVPDTSVGTNNTRPSAVRDASGAIWLFWTSNRAGAGDDLWLMRRNPATATWGQPRQITGSPTTDDQPFAVVAPNGVVWLFWRSDRAGVGNFDVYFKQLVTAI